MFHFYDTKLNSNRDGLFLLKTFQIKFLQKKIFKQKNIHSFLESIQITNKHNFDSAPQNSTIMSTLKGRRMNQDQTNIDLRDGSSTQLFTESLSAWCEKVWWQNLPQQTSKRKDEENNFIRQNLLSESRSVALLCWKNHHLFSIGPKACYTVNVRTFLWW